MQTRLGLSLTSMIVFMSCSSRSAPQPTGPAPNASATSAARGKLVTAVAQPKALSNAVARGLGWLVKHQLPNGGWGQGDEAPGMTGMGQLRDVANVADTSTALQAFLRAGHADEAAEYYNVVQRGLAFVLDEIERADSDSLAVTTVTGTRVQAKIGQYVDTFAALAMLQEATGRLDPSTNQRIDGAVRKIVRKLERQQRKDGSWEGRGWAPVLSQALASKGLNRAFQNGYTVSGDVLSNTENNANQRRQGDRYGGGDGAGVEIYSAAASSSGARDAWQSNQAVVNELKARNAPANEIAAAEQRVAASARAANDNEAALAKRLDEPSFIAGFGNNGGEEFLSYLMISETLVQTGGERWGQWDRRISQLVEGVQNEDGSWTGHHCITGRTFCTASALLVLMGDRTPVAAA